MGHSGSGIVKAHFRSNSRWWTTPKVSIFKSL